MVDKVHEKIKIGSEVGKKVHCTMCSKEGTTDDFITLRNRQGQNIHLCPECKEKTNRVFEDETKNPNIPKAIALGIGGGVLGGFIWYTIAIAADMEIGYVSILLGYLVGHGVYLGAGKKKGHQLQIISAFLAFISIVLTKKFMIDHYLDGYTVSLLNPNFWAALASPIGLFIDAIGIYVAYKVCRPRKI